MAGRHRFTEHDEIISEINVIPLVDISLVLLIIFMVTANFMTTYLNVKLPEAKASEEVVAKSSSQATITVTRDGPVYIENSLVTMEELKAQLKEKVKANPQLAVVLNVDKRANFGSAVAVLDILRALGIAATDISTVEGDR